MVYASSSVCRQYLFKHDLPWLPAVEKAN